jgi:hypothetical protein
MRRRHITLLLTALISLILVTTALAMSSANFNVDWYVLLNGGGRSELESTNYAADLTYGQTAIRAGASDNYRAGLGYWHGIIETDITIPIRIYYTQLPMLSKN